MQQSRQASDLSELCPMAISRKRVACNSCAPYPQSLWLSTSPPTAAPSTKRTLHHPPYPQSSPWPQLSTASGEALRGIGGRTHAHAMPGRHARARHACGGRTHARGRQAGAQQRQPTPHERDPAGRGAHLEAKHAGRSSVARCRIRAALTVHDEPGPGIASRRGRRSGSSAVGGQRQRWRWGRCGAWR